jgi:predicted nuclease of predicted toxin-antitoxin system
VKFLVDRSAGRRLAEWLRTQGHDVAEARERGADPGDRTLLSWASTEGRVLVTIDTDFGEFVFRESIPHAGLVRLPDVPASARIALMERVVLAVDRRRVERCRGDGTRRTNSRVSPPSGST